MATIQPKKTSTPSATSSRKGALTAGASNEPSKSPTRTPVMHAATTDRPGVNRVRSVRGNPPSARAAAKKSTENDDNGKAELQARLDDLHEQLRKAEDDASQAQQKAAVLQVKLDEAMKDQGALEENVHEHLERINDLENERKENTRARRELEQIFESERAAGMKEKEEMQTREHELRTSMQRLKETLAQKELRAGLDEDRPSRKSLSPSPVAEFAPPSLERSDSRSSSRLVMQKDKIIEELRLELAEAQIRLVEAENFGGDHMTKLQQEIYNLKMQNARFMEENESFQLLLQEKTLNGDFTNSELLRPSSTAGSDPPARNTLADELEASGEQDMPEEQRKLQAENNGLKDQNKALTLYINNIVSRLLQHEQFEHILDKTPDLFAKPAPQADKDKDLPPPPPEKDEAQGFLSRARSVLGGRPTRPTSQLIDENTAPSVHTNPQTAPQIPLARSGPARHGHRRANSDWGAANIVNNMYRPAPSNAVSPGLTSPTARTGGFFTQPLAPVPTRTPSGGMPIRTPSGTVSTIPETGIDGGQEQSDNKALQESVDSHPRDSKFTQRNSVQSIPDAVAGGDALSNPSSPPRSVASNDTRSMLAQPSVMVGSKMRPLRLVQENAEAVDDAGRKAANRGSWFGFLNKGV